MDSMLAAADLADKSAGAKSNRGRIPQSGASAALGPVCPADRGDGGGIDTPAGGRDV